MDVHCCNCGEPWDQFYLRHQLPKENKDAEGEGWRFGSSRLVVFKCPCCEPNDRKRVLNVDSAESVSKTAHADERDLKIPPPGPERAAVVQEIANLLGDDEDGLASTLEDFGL